MAILGGSPLGLVGVTSRPIQGTQMSSFNADNSRNINVDKYNTGTDNYPINELGNTKNGNQKIDPVNSGTRSLFTGQSVISPYANLGKIKTVDGGGQSTKYTYNGVSRNLLHNNNIYDTSLLNIIEQLANTEAALRPADFAYLKDVGVYPNNRLIIARRFLQPHTDNIFGTGNKGNVPMSIMISWKPQGEDFVEINFGEEWQNAKADFTGVLNSLGEDFMGKNVGSAIGGGLNVIPLPGFTEILQRRVLQQMGILNKGASEDPLPSGNPNLIKMAKRRKTIGYSDDGSGLKTTISIKMVCEWEQKFISGIDPTIAWQDIVAMVLRFGTSRSDTYGLNPNFETKINDWMINPDHIVTDMIKWIGDALISAKDELVLIAKRTTASILNSDIVKTDNRTRQERYNEQASIIDKAGTELVNSVKSGLRSQLQKYKLEIEGIARALSGAPSTPWHVTIGNPMRPVFCAGDMLVEDVKLNLGSVLAFNDLPATIKAEFTLTNARPWGLQEILAKFNVGSIRTLTAVKDSNSLNAGEKSVDNKVAGVIAGASQSNTLTSGLASVKTTAQNIKTDNVTQSKDINSIGFTLDTPKLVSSLKPIGLSGLTTTKEGKSGEQIIADVHMYIPTTNSLSRIVPITYNPPV
jgi:hypothetical protein